MKGQEVKKLIVTALSIGLAAALHRRARTIRFGYRLRSYAVGPRHYADRTRRTIHLQPIPADRAGQQIFTNTSRLPPRRCKPTTSPAAVQPRAPDDPRARCSIRDFCLRLPTCYCYSRYRNLWEFDGMAQSANTGKGATAPTRVSVRLPPT